MIDVENMVVDAVYQAVKTQYPNAEVTSEYKDIPSSFPCVSIMEEDNYTLKRTQDNDLHEHHANVFYSVNVYSNKKNGKKAEARAIINIVDNTLQSIKFTRTFMSPIKNIDPSIYRITARYEAIIEEKKGNTYQVYRN